MYSDGFLDGAIAYRLKVAKSTIRKWRAREGLPPNFSARRSSVTDQYRKLYDKGYSDQKIADALSRNRYTIRRWRRQNKLPANRREPVCSIMRYSRRAGPSNALSLDRSASIEGGSLYNIIRDDSWSNWLEEMGATVW
jgi:uncharacterized protein YjcR